MNDIHSQTDAYVVGGLTASEMREAEDHFATCAPCRAEVAELREITAALSQSVATDPPSALRASVLAAVAQTPQEATDEADTERADRAPHDEPDQQVATVVPLRRSRTTLVTTLIAAASILAAVAFGGYAWKSSQDANDATAQSRQLTELLSAGDVVVATDRFVDADHTGSVVMSQSRETAVLVATDLPDAPADQVYEAWTFSGDQPTPAGTFTPDGSQAVVELPAAALNADAVAITIEPEGGSDSPTTAPIFTVALPPS